MNEAVEAIVRAIVDPRPSAAVERDALLKQCAAARQADNEQFAQVCDALRGAPPPGPGGRQAALLDALLSEMTRAAAPPLDDGQRERLLLAYEHLQAECRPRRHLLRRLALTGAEADLRAFS
ncbi:MAG: hypothetical protein KDA41_10470, partial [Planctomycetales bacterium]|nr:hypothetical protein [Planctomycetales bacterium]